jgi:hypothetical protein
MKQIKKVILTTLFTGLGLVFANQASAIVYAGRASVSYNYNFTKGKVTCSGSIMFICCETYGNSIWVNYAGGFWANLDYSSPEVISEDGQSATSNHEFTMP